MVTAVKEKTVVCNDLDSAILVRAYRVMLLARATEDKLASLYRGGKITGGVYLGRGQEALSVAAALALIAALCVQPWRSALDASRDTTRPPTFGNLFSTVR